MSKYSNETVRNIFDWKPKSKNASKQLSQLLRHSFVKYEMPNFMDRVWLSEVRNYHFCYIELGLGTNLRKIPGLPINPSKKMAHYFGKAPRQFTVTSALRWAQVMSLSGDKDKAFLLANSYLGRNDFADEEYWVQLIYKLVREPNLSVRQLHLTTEYLREFKIENPDAKLNQRSLASIIKRATIWHEEQAKIAKKSKDHWEPSGILSFAKLLNNRHVHMVELLSYNELFQEGKRMKHCVGDYDYECKRKLSSIFSLRERVGNKYNSLATIEVDLKRKLVIQAKARFNNSVSSAEMKLIKNWAYMNELSIDVDL